MTLPLDRPAAVAALPHGLKVLVVGENASNRAIVGGHLAPHGARCTEAATAADALDALCLAVAEGEPFALAILDLGLPDREGLQLAADIQRAVELRATPLIMLSSGGADHDAAAREAGIAHCLAKPVRHDALVEAIAAATLLPVVPGRDEPIDRDRMRSMRAQYGDLLEQLIAIFAATTPEALDALERARDADTIRRVAHSLKGACQNVGAIAMAQLCRELEGEPALAATRVASLREALEPTLLALRGVAA